MRRATGKLFRSRALKLLRARARNEWSTTLKRSSLLRAALSGAALLSLMSAVPARADEPPPVVTDHPVGAGGPELDGTAEPARITIRDVQADEPTAATFDTPYRVASPGQPRPVTFVLHGGPGSNSLRMDIGLTGPMQLEQPGSEKLVAN